MGDTVDCGAVTAGDTIQFYLHSNESIVDDMNMYPEITLGGSGGGTAAIAARGGPTNGVSSLNLGSFLLKSLAEKKSPQEKLLAEKIKKIMSRHPLSSSRVAGLQQKNVKMQATQASAATLAAAQVNNPLAMLNFEDETDEGFNNVTANVLLAGTILLGETKYYYATVDPNNASNLLIFESYDRDIGDGDSRVIFEDPIPNNGDDKVGVYWEYMKPDGSGLNDGVIRLIGRYLKDDPLFEYKVWVHAVLPQEGRDAWITIAVKKPVVLGNLLTDPLYLHSTVKDVFGHNISLDELIIKYAGANGIPPQLIKGQMEQECMDVSTNVFEPVWRYEPMKDLDYQIHHNRRFFINSANNTPYPFTKTSDHPGGTGDWPPLLAPAGHSNVFPVTYPYTDPPQTIGGFLADNWPKYVKKGKLGETDTVLGSKSLTMRFKEIYKPPLKLNSNTDKVAKALAFATLGKELVAGKTNISTPFTKTAQTRIVTSYGFTQLMYTMTIDFGGVYNDETKNRYFPSKTHYMSKTDPSQYPEMLNAQDIFMPIYSDWLLNNLHRLLSKSIPASQWNGTKTITSTQKTITFTNFESAWNGSLYYYNQGPGYGDLVMQKSEKYLPH
jgi:hypothetical protein